MFIRNTSRVILLLLLFVGISYSATEFVCEIKPSGGDYGSLATWQDAIHGILQPTTTTYLMFTYTTKGNPMGEPYNKVFGLTSGSTGYMCYYGPINQIVLKHIDGNFVSGEKVFQDLYPSGWVTINDTGTAITVGCQVFSHSGIYGSLLDGATMHGLTSGAYARVSHVTATQILLKNIVGTFINGEQAYSTQDVNYVTLTNAGDYPVAVAKIEGVWTAPDTTKLSLMNWETGATNYIKIYTVGEARHSGTWNTKAYRLSGDVSSDGMIGIYEAFIWLDGLQIEQIHLNGFGVRDWFESSLQDGVLGEHKISNCIIRASTTTAPASRAPLAASLNASTATVKIWDCVFYGWAEGLTIGYSYATYYIYNNTFYQCDRAPSSEGSISRGGNYNIYLKNNLFCGTTACIKYPLGVSGYANVQQNNVTSDGTSPNAAYRYQQASFVDISNKNFFLSNNDTTCYTRGTDIRIDPSGGIDIIRDVNSVIFSTSTIGACGRVPVKKRGKNINELWE